jgi:hypothetical protein
MIALVNKFGLLLFVGPEDLTVDVRYIMSAFEKRGRPLLQGLHNLKYDNKRAI